MTTENSRVAPTLPATCIAVALALALAFWAPRADAANTLLVAPSGSDSGNCIDNACETIAYAVTQAAPDDAIQIAAGSYDEQIEITVPGLTLQGAPNLATVIGPEGSGVVEQTEITLADGVDGVTLRDLRVHSSAQAMPAILAGGDEAIDDLTLDGVAVSGIGPSTPPTTVGNGLEVKAPGSGWTIAASSFAFHYLGVVVFSDMTDFTVEGSSFDHNRAGFYVERTLPLSASSTGEIDGLRISDTTFAENEYVGLYFEGLGNATLDGVTVAGTGNGAGSLPSGARALVINLKAGPGGPVEVTDSAFTDSVHEGILVQARGWAGDTPIYEAAPASLSRFELTGSTVTGNGGPGVILNNQTTLGEAAVRGNRIVGNGTAGYDVTAPVNGVFAKNEADGGADLLADENWFGCNQSPASAGCAAVNAPVELPGWLVLTVDTAFPSLGVGEQTTAVAAIERNTGGDPLSPLPNGATAQFSSALGSFAEPSVPLLSGVASGEFTATSAGNGVITVSVDGEQASAPISVLAAEKPPEAQPLPPAPSAPEPLEPPTIEPSKDKGPTVVPSSGKVTVATISCAAESCTVKAQGEPSVKIGGKSFKVQVKLPKNLGEGNSGRVRVVLPRKTREALADKGKGKLTLKLKVTSSDGATRKMTVKVVLKGKGAPGKRT